MRMHKVLLATGLLAAVASSARADIIPFDPDGLGSDGTYLIGSMDFLQGNSLSEDVLLGGVGHTWTLYYQSSLGSLVDGGGNIITGTGLNTAYQITAVAAVDVVTTFISASSISFELAAAPSVNFFRMYWDAALNADPLAGTGFNDGTLILDSTVNSDMLGFFTFTAAAPSALDQFGTNNWPGTLTRSGIGAFSASANSSFSDDDFFVGAEDIELVFANTSEIVPFRETNPSFLFWDGGAFVPTTVGAINGTSGPDVILQADLNSSFRAVPEPASVVLWTLGLATMGVVQLRRRNKASA